LDVDKLPQLSNSLELCLAIPLEISLEVVSNNIPADWTAANLGVVLLSRQISNLRWDIRKNKGSMQWRKIILRRRETPTQNWYNTSVFSITYAMAESC
jgi:hypothetical protein